MEELRRESEELLKSLEKTVNEKELRIADLNVAYSKLSEEKMKAEGRLAVFKRRNHNLRRRGGFLLVQLVKAQLRYICLVQMAKQKFQADAEARVERVRA